MSKTAYVRICMEQPPEWLHECAANPSSHMRPLHVALIRVALRRMKKGGRA